MQQLNSQSFAFTESMRSTRRRSSATRRRSSAGSENKETNKLRLQSQQLSALFSVGDRVVLPCEKQDEHGRIAAIEDSKKYLVLLDLVDRCPFRWVNLNEMELEESVPLHRVKQRAACSEEKDSMLEPNHAKALCFILDTIRYLVCVEYGGDYRVKQMSDIERLFASKQSAKIHSLTTFGWSHWRKASNQFRTSPSVLSTLQRFLTEDYPRLNHGNLPDFYPLVLKALQDPAGTAGWSRRITASFWVVGRSSDGTGIYLIPDANHMTVYKVLHAKGAAELAEAHQRPILLKLTILSWFGRLVTDGVVSGTQRPGPPVTIQVADKELTTKLQTIVFESLAHVSYVDRLRELELVDPGIPYSGGTLSEEADFTMSPPQVQTTMNVSAPILNCSRPDSPGIGSHKTMPSLVKSKSSPVPFGMPKKLGNFFDSEKKPVNDGIQSRHELLKMLAPPIHQLQAPAEQSGKSMLSLGTNRTSASTLRSSICSYQSGAWMSGLDEDDTTVSTALDSVATGLDTVGTNFRKAKKRVSAPKVEKPPTTKESLLVEALSELEPYPTDDSWVFMKEADGTVFLFSVQGGQRRIVIKSKKPTASEILKAIYKNSDVWRPKTIFVDSKRLVERLSWLMREVDTFEVHYVSTSILTKQDVKGNQLIAKQVIEQCRI